MVTTMMMTTKRGRQWLLQWPPTTTREPWAHLSEKLYQRQCSPAARPSDCEHSHGSACSCSALLRERSKRILSASQGAGHDREGMLD